MLCYADKLCYAAYYTILILYCLYYTVLYYNGALQIPAQLALISLRLASTDICQPQQHSREQLPGIITATTSSSTVAAASAAAVGG